MSIARAGTIPTTDGTVFVQIHLTAESASSRHFAFADCAVESDFVVALLGSSGVIWCCVVVDVAVRALE